MRNAECQSRDSAPRTPLAACRFAASHFTPRKTAMTTTRTADRSFVRGCAIIVAALGAMLAVALPGACSTTEGFGKDVKNLGGGIENSAAKNK